MINLHSSSLVPDPHRLTPNELASVSTVHHQLVESPRPHCWRKELIVQVSIFFVQQALRLAC